MNGLLLNDYPGVLPQVACREYFERAVKQTPTLCRMMNLLPLMNDGKFIGYMDVETQRVFFGFSIGMRTSERLALAVLQQRNPGQFI